MTTVNQMKNRNLRKMIPAAIPLAAGNPARPAKNFALVSLLRVCTTHPPCRHKLSPRNLG
jgi:hypothetical protein